MFANRARVLVAEAMPPDELDVSELKQRLEDAEQSLKEAEEGSAAAEQAERERARCEAFIKIAEKLTPPASDRRHGALASAAHG